MYDKTIFILDARLITLESIASLEIIVIPENRFARMEEPASWLHRGILVKLLPSDVSVPWALRIPCVRLVCPMPVTPVHVRMVGPAHCPPSTPTSAHVLWDGQDLTAPSRTTVPANLAATRPLAIQRVTTTNALARRASMELTATLMWMNAEHQIPVSMEDVKTPTEVTSKLWILKQCQIIAIMVNQNCLI